MLAAMVPLLAGLASLTPRDPKSHRYGLFAGIVFALIFPLVFVTGSRSGLLLLALGIALAAVVLGKMKRIGRAIGQVRARPLMVGVVLAVVAGGTAMALFRVGAVDRMLTQSAEEDLRVSLFGSVAQMARLYFPAGAGLLVPSRRSSRSMSRFSGSIITTSTTPTTIWRRL